MATHSSILAWRIPWTEELGGLQSTGRKESDTTEQLHFLSLSLFTQRKPLEYKTWHHPTTSSNLCRTPHLNNKQNKNTNPMSSRQDHHLTQPCPSEEKQTNKPQHKSHPIHAHTKHWTNLRRAETKRKKEFNLEAWERETSNTVS